MNVNKYWHDGYALFVSTLNSLFGRLAVAAAFYALGFGLGGITGLNDSASFGDSILSVFWMTLISVVVSYGILVIPLCLGITICLVRLEAGLPWFSLLLPPAWLLSHDMNSAFA